MKPVRPCGVSDCGSSPAGAVGAGSSDVLDDRLELASPDADGAAHALRPLAGRDRLAAVVTVSDHGGDDEHQHDTDCDADDPGERSAPRPTLPGTDSSSTTATSSCQKRSTVGMLTRSSGECGPSICGPIASMSRRPLTLLPMTAVSRPAWIAVTTGGSPKSRSYTVRATASSVRVEVGPPAVVVVLHLERAAGEPRGSVERGDHLGQRRVVRRAREAVQRQPLALGGGLAERRARLDELVEIGAHRERPVRYERDDVEERGRCLLRPGVGGVAGGSRSSRSLPGLSSRRRHARPRSPTPPRPGTRSPGRAGPSRQLSRRGGWRYGSCRRRARRAGTARSRTPRAARGRAP